MLNDDFADLQPGQPKTDEEKIDTLLDLLSSGGFEGDPDLDLVRDLALQHLLQYPKLPERTVEIMLAIIADMGESELVLERKEAALAVLSKMSGNR
ncbi:MAG: hypothetical protein KF774_18285 [Planctomyces sp.]|nr:hypothetical protein [Planctomyces sp.]